MVKYMPVLDVLINGVKKEINNVITFATTPVGIFETIDKMIIDARTTGRQLISEVTGMTPLKMLRGRRIRVI